MTRPPAPPGGGAAGAVVRFRPHHFLCALGFAGRGYSDRFTANLAAIVEGRLRAPGGEATPIEVTGAADDICAPCPRRRGTGCTVQEKILRLDAAHAAALGIAPGDRLTWGEARARIRARVRPGSLAGLCAGCEWLGLGLCEAALAALQKGGGPAGPSPEPAAAPWVRGAEAPLAPGGAGAASGQAPRRAPIAAQPPETTSAAITALTASPIRKGEM